MDSFYTIVLAIAVICLILILISFALIIRKANKNKSFPPTKSRCPDYWGEVNGNCVINTSNPVNVGKLNLIGNTYSLNAPSGASGVNTINPDAPTWANYMGSSTDICGKKAWSNANQISWDGIANFNGCA